MNYKNFTNHTVTIYNSTSLQTDGRNNNDYFTLPNYDPEILTEIPQSGRPLNAHHITGNLKSSTFDEIQFQHPKIVSMIPDPFPEALDPAAVYIVSTKYANFASVLPFNIYDALFVPEGRVYEYDDQEKRRIIGCIGLQKVARYQVPSVYLQAVEGVGLQPSLITVQCAIQYWRQRYTQLSINEQMALNTLETTLRREVSVCH